MIQPRIFFENSAIRILTDDVITTTLVENSSIDLIITQLGQKSHTRQDRSNFQIEAW